jgi:MYXO-CTERM domain-containing protein
MHRLASNSLYSALVAGMALIASLVACGDGGCGGCAECGIAPIPGAYPLEHRIENSAQVRLSPTGIGFIEENIAAIVAIALGDGEGLRFPVEGPIDVALGIEICTDNDCAAQIEIVGLEAEPVAPNILRALIRVNVDSRSRAGLREAWSGDCNIDIDTRAGRPYVGIQADLVFANTTQAARLDYTRVRVENIEMVEALETDDFDISGGFLGSCAIANVFGGILTGLIEDQVGGLLQETIDEQLCQTRGPVQCPTGTFAVPDEDPDSVCRFGPSADSECVPILIGTDGRGDLGGTLLGGFSPGTHANAQFLLASGREGEAVRNGMSLFFYGGFMGTDRTFTQTPAHNSCVPLIDRVTIGGTEVTFDPALGPPLPTIPRLEAFRGSPERDAHVGIGIAEAYMDYAGYGMFDSGMLCLGAGTRLSQMLSTALVSAAIMSLPDLTHPITNAPLTVAVRPQTPPDFTIGAGGMEDPLLQIALNTLQIDFYVWSTERYVRFMTFQTNLRIGIDLAVEAGQIVPMIRFVSASNSTVTNSELLEERPDQLASTLETLISTLAGQLTSGISPFDLPEIMGFELEVPADGLTRVTEGSNNFLGLFANLRLAGPSPIVAPVETSLSVTDLSLDRESMHPEHWNEGTGNTVWLHFGAQGPLGVEYEYAYRIDEGPWSAWTTDERIQIDDDVLLLQARHNIEARARVAGEPTSVDETPASADLLIDILAPRVIIERTGDSVEVIAHDVVTDDDALEYRYSIDGVWTDWVRDADAEVPHDDSQVIVEVRDEAGNVGRAEAGLIRGLPDPGAENNCGCVAPGSGPNAPIGLMVLFAIGGATLLRRRRFLVVGAAALALIAGCECGTPMPPEPCDGECSRDELCCEATMESEDMCVEFDIDALCEPGYECDDDNVVIDETCEITCSECMVRPALDPGNLATDLDMVVDGSGMATISGYNGGFAGGNDSELYGDLVVGQWSGGEVSWEIVDGAPSMPITNDPAGWRGGVSAPGDDVGRWTSIVSDGANFLVSYYDATNSALKMATGGPGNWAIHTVDDAGDSGRYSSMVLAGGVPTVAYLRMQESATAPGQVNGTVMVATANIAVPTAPTDWTITEVASAPMPCRAAFCASGTTCLESGQCVTPTSDCGDACGSGDVCFNGSCTASVPSGYVEDLPPAYGLYTSLAVDPTGGLGLVWYDRTTGNIFGASNTGAGWTPPFWIDGYLSDDEFIGDCGQGADLFIDEGGLWHVSYIDGTEETLRYSTVNDGVVQSSEIVDDGSTDGMTRHTDGRHIVGDDSSIVVATGGALRIAYQDATAQHAVVAVRGGGGGQFLITHFDTVGSTGYWIDQELVGTDSYVALWFRQRDGRDLNNGTRVIVLR